MDMKKIGLMLLVAGALAANGAAKVEWNRPLLKDYNRYVGWPTAYRTAKGEILAVFSGDRAEHVCPYGKVQLVRSGDGGESWSVPQTICNSQIDDRDAGIIELKNGDLVLFWFTSLAFYEYADYRKHNPEYTKIYETLTDDTKRMLLGSWARRSTDGGKTWSQPVRVPVMTPHGGKLLKDGRILVVGVHSRQSEGMLTTDKNQPPKTFQVAESTDGGRSFHVIGTIPMNGVKQHWSLAEPTFYEAEDGTITTLIRYEMADDGSWGNDKVYPRYMLKSVSKDGGRTWSKVERTNIDGFPPHVLRLRDGRLLCSYASRTPGRIGIYAAFSEDDGKTWRTDEEVTLARSDNADLGYPSTVENADGSLLTVYYGKPAKDKKNTLMGTKWRADKWVRQAINLNVESQRAMQPKFEEKSYACGVTDEMGPNGKWSYRFRVTKAWCGELPQWPSVNLKPQITDWTQYDRLVVDVYNDSTGGDTLSIFISNPEGRIQNGLSHHGVTLNDYGYTRWTISLKNWPKTCDPKRIGRVHFFMTTPNSANVMLSGFYLLKNGEKAPEIAEEFIATKVRPGEERARKLALERRQASLDKFIGKCRSVGQDGSNAWIGKATSMDRVRPRDNFEADAADAFSLKAAKGEYESLQVLVVPSGKDLKNVKVRVESDGGLPASAFKVSPVGYSQTVKPAPYRIGANVSTNNLPGGYYRERYAAGLGWWPDPILDWLDGADIAQGDVQSFWVRLRVPPTQAAGLYRGKIKVSGEGWEKEFPLSVRVWNFSVPKQSPLPMAVTFGPGPTTQFADEEQLELNRRLWADKESPVNMWKKHRIEWGDFLADYYLGMDSLYHRGGVQWDVIQRLKEQGRLVRFNLGYWDYPREMTDAAKEEWRKSVLAHLTVSYNKAKELGLLDHAYIYGCDEIPQKFFVNIRWALDELKKAFPGVPISTTAYDHDFGVGTVLSAMDWFTPTTDDYDQNFAKVGPSRKAGHQIWWYIACGQQAPRANLFVENQPIEARQLMGAQTVKYRPDGFLYYQTSIWNTLKCINGRSTFTNWDPRSWTTFHGDGSWFCCGPDGIPCATVRIENFRDGVEDYAYALEYERQTGKKVEVPDSVCRSVWQYCDDSKVYYAWRDAIAAGIEEAKNK